MDYIIISLGRAGRYGLTVVSLVSEPASVFPEDWLLITTGFTRGGFQQFIQFFTTLHSVGDPLSRTRVFSRKR